MDLELPPGLELVWERELHAHAVRWAPGGRQVGFAGGRNGGRLLVADAPDWEGWEITLEANGPVLPTGMAWSPDGVRCGVVGFSYEYKASSSSIHAWEVHVHRGKAERLPAGSTSTGGLTSIGWVDGAWALGRRLRRMAESRIVEVSWGKAFVWREGGQARLWGKLHGGGGLAALAVRGDIFAFGYNSPVTVLHAPTATLLAELEIPGLVAEGQFRVGVTGLAFTLDSRVLFASRSGLSGGQLLAWRTDTWKRILDVPWAFPPNYLSCDTIDIDADTGLLAACLHGHAVILRVDVDRLLADSTPVSDSVAYRNAKVVLVGDSGVGKSGLALTLCGEPFRPTESTHGRQVRTLFDESAPSDHGSERRETLLWDLAGQPGYRLIHQLYLGDADVAVVVLDGRSETDPFAGVQYWSHAIDNAALAAGRTRPLVKLLAMARMDRGGVGLSRERIERKCAELGFAGWFETSAKESWGVDELRNAIRDAVDWDRQPVISTFRQVTDLQEFVEDRGGQRPVRNLRQLTAAFNANRDDELGTDDVRACLQRLASRGIVHLFGFGERALLQPERLDGYAASLVEAAKQEPDGYGFIAEDMALQGDFPMPQDERLADRDDEALLLAATVRELLKYEVALREPGEEGALLVFPTQMVRENLTLPDPPGKAVRFRFRGASHTVYATLAVRIAQSGQSRHHDIWKNAVQFEDRDRGGVCGIALRQLDEGEAELTVFYEHADDATRARFEGFVAAHLRRRAVPDSVSETRILHCPLGHALPEDQVRWRLDNHFGSIVCGFCEARVALDDKAPTPDVERELGRLVQAADDARARETGLTEVTGQLVADSGELADWAGAARATLALVFTDVIGSTGLGVRLGDEAMSEVRQAHFDQASRLLQAHGGRLVKTIGDAVMALFRNAPEALDFAMALHTDTGHAHVAIRAGLHIGPMDLEGGDAFGSMVAYTARVEATAKGAEVRVSERFHEDIVAAGREAHANLDWERYAVDASERQFKGFQGQQIVYALTRA